MTNKNYGNSDVNVSPIIFGGNVFGWTLDEKQSFDILDYAFENGFNTIDSANIYSNFVPGNDGSESETIIGKWMKQRGNRKEMAIITKVGGPLRSDTPNTSKKFILEEVENSLKHLQTDYIDIYFNHVDDTITPVEETLEAFDEIVKSGKARVIAASQISPERLVESLETSKARNLVSYIGLQPEYNLYDREEFETKYLSVSKQYGLAVTPFFSLASGFLTGKYKTKEDFGKYPRGGSVEMRYNNKKGLNILKVLNEVAERNHTKMSSVALAWLMKHPFITAPIASATQKAHIDDFVSAVNLDLSDEDFHQLKKAGETQSALS